MGEWVSFPTATEQIDGYLATPAGPAPWPALIVIHPIMGVTPQMREITDGYAADGYLTVAPNLYTNDPEASKHDFAVISEAAHFSNHGSWEDYLASLTDSRRTEIVAARTWMSGRKRSGFLDAVRGTFDYLKGRSDVTRVGSIGYCQGGQLTGALAALGVDLDAGVMYYGGPAKAEQVANIRAPLQGHYGITDHHITEKIYDFALAMKAAGKHFAYSVYDADHGFNDAPPSRSHNAEASRQARERSSEFLAQYLKRG